MPLGCYHSQCEERKEHWKQEERTGETVLFVHLHQDTDGWAISGHGSMDQTLLLTQVTESASPEFQMRSNFPGEI